MAVAIMLLRPGRRASGSGCADRASSRAHRRIVVRRSYSVEGCIMRDRTRASRASAEYLP